MPRGRPTRRRGQEVDDRRQAVGEKRSQQSSAPMWLHGRLRLQESASKALGARGLLLT